VSLAREHPTPFIRHPVCCCSPQAQPPSLPAAPKRRRLISPPCSRPWLREGPRWQALCCPLPCPLRVKCDLSPAPWRLLTRPSGKFLQLIGDSLALKGRAMTAPPSKSAAQQWLAAQRAPRSAAPRLCCLPALVLGAAAGRGAARRGAAQLCVQLMVTGCLPCETLGRGRGGGKPGAGGRLHDRGGHGPPVPPPIPGHPTPTSGCAGPGVALRRR
jgi:hypothetical protein